jgi:hypothetical protein
MNLFLFFSAIRNYLHQKCLLIIMIIIVFFFFHSLSLLSFFFPLPLALLPSLFTSLTSLFLFSHLSSLFSFFFVLSDKILRYTYKNYQLSFLLKNVIIIDAVQMPHWILQQNKSLLLSSVFALDSDPFFDF